MKFLDFILVLNVAYRLVLIQHFSTLLKALYTTCLIPISKCSLSKSGNLSESNPWFNHMIGGWLAVLPSHSNICVLFFVASHHTLLLCQKPALRRESDIVVWSKRLVQRKKQQSCNCINKIQSVRQLILLWSKCDKTVAQCPLQVIQLLLSNTPFLNINNVLNSLLSIVCVRFSIKVYRSHTKCKSLPLHNKNQE